MDDTVLANSYSQEGKTEMESCCCSGLNGKTAKTSTSVVLSYGEAGEWRVPVNYRVADKVQGKKDVFSERWSRKCSAGACLPS